MNREIQLLAFREMDQDTSRLAELPASRRVIATVSATSPLAVSWRGVDTPANGKNVATTVVVGDRVVCDLIDGQLVVDYVIS